MMSFALAKLQIPPTEFWKLTFAEWRPMYDAIMGKQERPMTKAESNSLIADYQKKFAKDANGKS